MINNFWIYQCSKNHNLCCDNGMILVKQSSVIAHILVGNRRLGMPELVTGYLAYKLSTFTPSFFNPSPIVSVLRINQSTINFLCAMCNRIKFDCKFLFDEILVDIMIDQITMPEVRLLRNIMNLDFENDKGYLEKIDNIITEYQIERL